MAVIPSALLFFSACAPTAVFWSPVVRLKSALEPRAVLLATSRKAEEGSSSSLSRVSAGIASIRRRADRLHCGQESKAGEHETRQREVNKFRYCFHVSLPFIILLRDSARRSCYQTS